MQVSVLARAAGGGVWFLFEVNRDCQYVFGFWQAQVIGFGVSLDAHKFKDKDEANQWASERCVQLAKQYNTTVRMRVRYVTALPCF